MTYNHNTNNGKHRRLDTVGEEAAAAQPEPDDRIAACVAVTT